MELLSRARNRAILSLLDDAARPLSVSDLADRLATRDTPVLRSAEYEDEFERVVLSLHHDRLPKLAEAGLVEYDRDENVVDRRDTTAVEAEWLDVDLFDELLARFQSGREPDEETLGVIEGRQNVIEHGRNLADEADEELFCLYVSDDLLEAECVRRAEAAIDRGVDIHLGSQNPKVRDLTRERLPEATLWEPQLDWMNTASTTPTVGRLVLADREKIMLAILDEPDADDTSQETAMIGEGRANPLVVLARELLGPRLDHLDYQSGDFRSELPF